MSKCQNSRVESLKALYPLDLKEYDQEKSRRFDEIPLAELRKEVRDDGNAESGA